MIWKITRCVSLRPADIRIERVGSFKSFKIRGRKGGLSVIVSGSLPCDTLTLPDCDVGQFLHSRLVRGPQPLIDCFPETCGRRGLERGETCGRWVGIGFTHYRMRPEHCAGVLVIL